jgi:hypothetical protein
MFVLTRSIAVFDEHTRLTRLEADATPILLAALGTAVACCTGTTIHPSMLLNFKLNVMEEFISGWERQFLLAHSFTTPS